MDLVDNQNLLTGAVMLETMWKTRNKDLIDLISPFVFYAVAKVCSPNEIIDQRKALEKIKTEFGYIDMPLAIIEKVLKRNPTLFRKNGSQYRLISDLDEAVKEIEKRRDDGAHKIGLIGSQLSEYFETHLRSRRKYTTEESITELQRFFSKHGIFLGTNRLEESVSTLKGRETDYYVAQYLFEKRDNHQVEYDYVIDLVKGYFLQSAIYLQATNGNIKSSTYKDVEFYYDTPFLLRFPLISAGIFGYPLQDAWNIAVRACLDFVEQNKNYDLKIVFAVLSDSIIQEGCKQIALDLDERIYFLKGGLNAK